MAQFHLHTVAVATPCSTDAGTPCVVSDATRAPGPRRYPMRCPPVRLRPACARAPAPGMTIVVRPDALLKKRKGFQDN